MFRFVETTSAPRPASTFDGRGAGSTATATATTAALAATTTSAELACAEPRRVLAIASNLAQASARLRIAAMVEPLRRRGFELDVHPFPREWAARRRLLSSASTYHAVVLHRKLLDPWNWHLLRRHARRVIFDVDDAVRFHPSWVGPYSRVRTAMRFAATARNVQHIVAGNPYLADMFRRDRRDEPTTILPTTIDTTRYRLKEHVETNTPRLVWIGSRSTVRYLEGFVRHLERAATQVRGLRLLTIADASVRSSIIPIEHVPWTLTGEADALCRGDIGIAPTPLDRWTLGKCGFKILQYMAAGLPVIASPVGANASLVRDGETGLLPARPDDWADAIKLLADDIELRRRMGLAGRRAVERDFRVDRAADAWAELLAE